MALSRQMVLFCVERRKAWRMLQSRAGVRNVDYEAQKAVRAALEAEETPPVDRVVYATEHFAQELANLATSPAVRGQGAFTIHAPLIRMSKADIIRQLLGQWEIAPGAQVVMIGDRSYDVEGARANGLDSIAVGYGYGTPDELRQAAPTHAADSVEALASLLLT